MIEAPAIGPEGRVFSSLTGKQREVLDLLADNRTTKEIARLLDVSDSAVNQRIEPLRQRLGGITRAELARRYRAYASEDFSQSACKVFIGETLQVASPGNPADEWPPDDRRGRYRFEDVVSFPHEPPWEDHRELRIVPRLLDGAYAVWVRAIAVGALTLLIIACLVLGLTAAQVLTDTLGERRPGSDMSQ